MKIVGLPGFEPGQTEPKPVVFMETHEDPSVAKSDGANMLKLAGI